GDITACRVAANLIGGRVVDACSVIGALVIVEVVLELAAELDEVSTLELGQVIGEKIILAVPDTGTNVLRIHVVGRKNNGGTLAERFDRSGRAGDLRWSVCPLPLPEVAQVAVVKIVGK